jgi:hypothetical protein
VLRVWAKRNNDPGRWPNKAPCRPRSVLCHLVAGGIRKEISPPGNARFTGSLNEGTGSSTTPLRMAAVSQIRHPSTERRNYYLPSAG